MTGKMLDDGSVRYPNLSRDGKITDNARYGMTMGLLAHDYMVYLYDTVYAAYSSTGLLP